MDISSTPIPVRKALKRFGQGLCHARKRRRVPMKLAAERASISRTTLSKIENGDEGVSMGAYAKVLFTMNLLGPLAKLAEPEMDEIGLELEIEKLPKRIRLSRRIKRH